MLPKLRAKTGGLAAWTIAVLAVLVISILMLRPSVANQTTLEDSLGAAIQIETLPL